eukprot:UN28942
MQLVHFTASDCYNIGMDQSDINIFIHQLAELKSMTPEQLNLLVQSLIFFKHNLNQPEEERIVYQKTIIFDHKPLGLTIERQKTGEVFVSQVSSGGQAESKGVRPLWLVFSVNNNV